MHLLRGNIGAGVFGMGDAFKNGGLLLSPLLTITLGIVCVHSQHMLVRIIALIACLASGCLVYIYKAITYYS